MMKQIAYTVQRGWLRYLIATCQYRRAELARIVKREDAALAEEESELSARLASLEVSTIQRRAERARSAQS